MECIWILLYYYYRELIIFESIKRNYYRFIAIYQREWWRLKLCFKNLIKHMNSKRN